MHKNGISLRDGMPMPQMCGKTHICGKLWRNAKEKFRTRSHEHTCTHTHNLDFPGRSLKRRTRLNCGCQLRAKEMIAPCRRDYCWVG